MTLGKMTAGSVLGAMLICSGCSQAGPDDPLTGSWKNTQCYGSASLLPNVASCSTTLAFDDDLQVTLTAEEHNEPAAATLPRCITTRVVTGHSWSTTTTGKDHFLLTIEGEGQATLQRSGCVHPEDDLPSQATSDIAIPSGEMAYELTGSSLVIGVGDLRGQYAR